MFGALKKIFGKSRLKGPVETSPPTAAVAAVAEQEPEASPPDESPQLNDLIPATPKLRPAATKAVAKPPSADTVTISFAKIVPALPKEVVNRATVPGLDRATFSLPIKAVLQQLATGAIRIPLSELRKSAPLGLLVKSTADEDQLITLPLGEIVTQLPAARFASTTPRKRVDVPEEVGAIFTPGRQQPPSVRVLDKNEAAAATAAGSAAAKAAAGRPKPPEITRPQPSSAPAPAPAPGRSISAFPKTPGNAARSITPTPKEPPKPLAEERVRLPLEALAKSWPDQIRLEIANQNFSEGICCIPTPVLREGLKQPKVKYPWKQLRAWTDPAPIGLSAYSELILELPLQILAEYAPELVPSQPINQKVATAEIPDVFNRGSATLPAPATIPAPAPVASPSRTAAPAAVVNGSLEAPTPPAVTHNPIPFAGFGNSTAKPVAKESAPPPAAAPAPALAAAPAPKSPRATVPATPVVASNVAPASAAANTSGSTGKQVVSIPLSAVKGAWPESLQQEIEALNLSAGSLEIPIDSVEASLKSGKVSFPWKQLWVWLKPTPTGSPTHCHADLRLDMPLEIVAPLFLAQRPKPVAKKVATVIHIPDLFNAAGPVAPGPETDTARTPAAPLVAPAAPATIAPEAGPRKVAQSLGELFNAPEKRSWTPNEIVHETSALPGVAGALIALQDGLLVASCMPPNWKTETIAAFLPQIFGRLRQYSKELDMGELQSISFGVEQGVFQVFNAGIIYFAAAATPGHVLPVAELQLIAQELSRHTK